MSANLNTYSREAKRNLLSCRPGDWQHALRVVEWVRELTPKFFPEKDLLIRAAYIHDLGWREIFSKSKKTITKAELTKHEAQANDNTQVFVIEFLTKLNHSKNEISEILRFIKAVDQREAHDKAEAILLDADSLSKLNINHISEKYTQTDWLEIYNLFQTALPQTLTTEKGKKRFPVLLTKLKQEIDRKLNK